MSSEKAMLWSLFLSNLYHNYLILFSFFLSLPLQIHRHYVASNVVNVLSFHSPFPWQFIADFPQETLYFPWFWWLICIVYTKTNKRGLLVESHEGAGFVGQLVYTCWTGTRGLEDIMSLKLAVKENCSFGP